MRWRSERDGDQFFNNLQEVIVTPMARSLPQNRSCVLEKCFPLEDHSPRKFPCNDTVSFLRLLDRGGYRTLLTKTGLVIGLLILATVGSATPGDEAFAKQAVRCGIKPDQIVWTKDSRGAPHPLIAPNGSLDSLSFSKLKCMLDWGQRTRTKIGFISQPPAR
jgi:hypothetical protein